VNGGSGAFTTASFPLGTHVQDIVLADFDVDGDADIGGLDVSVNLVRIAENTGAGSFFVGQGFAVGASTSTLIAADLDGNFIQDLVTADFGAGLSLLVNALPGPVMGPAGAGNTPDGTGGLFDALMIDGSAGGPARRVNAVAGSTIIFSVSPPPLGPASAPFLVWGTLGAPTAASQTTLPIGLGEMSFPPFHLDPSNPILFVLANGFFPDPAALVAPPAAPWSIPLTLPPFAATASLQGLVQEAGGLRVTNGLILVVQ
jgi:hypothetical protein